ncbi:hypothetical protein BU25DRAFT_247006 [Macroventuria anomochaeta]|uniref:Uncharacterized protein n=1 Tax=Macroventuria anomochaeta TaxID=301207 RepID=A0ACB6S9U8_9PLEO|nr:uncharacterized protein BU25DRAFT_247006 [Macroventuria anomochaeta]KAF2630748.1 hypothetical protein BU25DRAFT_247006 [Macroventuria anomochaeta]
MAVTRRTSAVKQLKSASDSAQGRALAFLATSASKRCPKRAFNPLRPVVSQLWTLLQTSHTDLCHVDAESTFASPGRSRSHYHL